MPNSAPSGSVQIMSQLGSTTTRTLNASDITDPTTQFYWDPAQGGNGHIYEYAHIPIDSVALFDGNEAINGRYSSPRSGINGYLVSITSAAEQNFVTKNLGNMTAYIGLILDAGAGLIYTSGPEAGTSSVYYNWAGGEPGIDPWVVVCGKNNLGQAGKWYGGGSLFNRAYNPSSQTYDILISDHNFGGRGENIFYFDHVKIIADEYYKNYILSTLPTYPIANPSFVRRQNIWHNSRRKLAECEPRLGLGFRRRACGVASVDARWSVA